MEFSTNGQKVVLQGAKSPSFKLINNKSFAQIVQKEAELCFLIIMHQDSSFIMHSYHALQGLDYPVILPNSIEELIDTYNDIFSDPTTLPPPRPGFDHMIPLKQWFKWLSLAEWWYNTNYRSSIHTTPFEVVYGQPPPIHLPYLPGSAINLTVDRYLMAREEAIKLLKFHLLRAQNRMTQQANKHMSDRVFAIRDYVYLKLQPYRQLSMKSHGVHKLLPKFYDPYQVVDRIGATAYQLQLPSSTAIHNVFHVSQLKLCPNPENQSIQHLPAALPIADKVPVAILDRKMVKMGHTAATKVLVQWKDLPLDKAIWEFYYDLLKKFPDLHP
ncbi:Ty3/gypsy retrotransposon protein [Trifolium pratense]|uniref:Ty3/gypsy retrotransposon protein n=1 Tax=Trifolium pratense TaxID=57577 RepID=A0A2K3KXZ4_TRIPR|nr:Ty3/gypsy retrotransposon protein [Trifolium pratense]